MALASERNRTMRHVSIFVVAFFFGVLLKLAMGVNSDLPCTVVHHHARTERAANTAPPRAGAFDAADKATTHEPTVAPTAAPPSTPKPSPVTERPSSPVSAPSREYDGGAPIPRYWERGPARTAAKVSLPDNLPDVVLPSVGPDDPINVMQWHPEENDMETDYLRMLFTRASRGGNVTIKPMNLRMKTGFRRHDEFMAPDKGSTSSNIVMFHGLVEDMQKCDSWMPEKVQFLSPALTIVLSDEQSASWCAQQRLADLAPLTLRQYSPMIRRNMHHRPNVLTMMLGYSRGNPGYLPSWKQTPASKRKYTWAWYGQRRKGDRDDMLKALSHAFEEHVAPQGIDNSKVDMARDYMSAQFVPIGAGFLTLDCFRITEASLAGAIPIVRGTKKEVEQTFAHYIGSEGKLPPWIFVEKWSQAPTAMRELLAQDGALDDRQNAARTWFERSVNMTVAVIRNALEVDVLFRRSREAAARAWERRGRKDVAAVLRVASRPDASTRDGAFAGVRAPPPRSGGAQKPIGRSRR